MELITSIASTHLPQGSSSLLRSSLSSALAMEAKSEKPFVEIDSSDSESQSDYDGSSDDDEVATVEENTEQPDSDAEEKTQADKTPKKVDRPVVAAVPSDATHSPSLPLDDDQASAEKTPSAKSKKSSSLTRLQEADILLRIYDALAAYRRPTQQSSLSRKLSSIDTAVSLLENLRQQLTQGPEKIVENSASSEPSAATSSPQPPKSKAKPSKPSISKKEDAADDTPKAQKAKPNSVSKFFSAERTREILESESGSKVNAKELKSRIDEEWASLKPGELEIWTSKFYVLHGSLYDKFDRSPHEPKKESFAYSHNVTILDSKATEGQGEKNKLNETHTASKVDSPSPAKPSSSSSHLSSQASTSPSESPSEVIHLNIVNASSIDIKSPPPSTLVWKVSPNPRIAGKEDVMASLKGLRPFAALSSLRKAFSALAMDAQASHLALNDGHQTLAYSIEPGTTTLPPSLREKVIIPNRSQTRSSCIALALSPGGTHLYIADSDRYIRKWSLQTYKLEAEVWGGSKDILSLTLSTDGASLAWVSEDKHVYLIDTLDMQLRRRYGSNGQKRFLNTNFVSVALSANGAYLSAGDAEGIIRTWENVTGQLLSHYNGHTGAISKIFVSETKTFVSASIQGQVRSWDLNSSASESNYANLTSSILALDIEEQRRLFFVGGKDQLLRVFPLPEHPNTAETPAVDPYTIVIGHKSAIVEVRSAVAKGKELIVASLSSDGTAALWTL